MIGAQYPGAEHVHTLYKQYREYIVHEDNLINHRSTWIYMIQSFLVASYGFAIKLEGSDKLKPIFQRPDDTAPGRTAAPGAPLQSIVRRICPVPRPGHCCKVQCA